MSRTRAAIACMGAALLLGASISPAASRPPAAGDVVGRQGPVAAAGPGGFAAGYLTPVLLVEKGGELTFANLDIARHNVVHDVVTDGFGGPHDSRWCPSDRKGKRKHKKGHRHHDHGKDCPAFYSPLITLGQTTQVEGLDNLDVGQVYSFFCTQHHNMKGKLLVVR